MRSRIELLPDTVPWKQVEIKVLGGYTKEPLTLYFRPAIDCFKLLFGNPLFSGYMDYRPRREYTDETKGERLYNEIMTGDRTWYLQVRRVIFAVDYLSCLNQHTTQKMIEPGQTLGLVILSSDKTHLTVGQGDKECHAVYMSCGNIKKNLRTKVGAHCWMMIAQIPIAKFEPKKHQSLLTNRLIHQCLDITLDSLKKCAKSAETMTDPCGQMRSVRTFLAAYIADLPEQQVLACVRTNYAPSSHAGPTTLGASIAQKLRHGSQTLDSIKKVADEVEENDLERWKELSAEYNLNGVDKPFWRNWLHSADPSLFLAPDALHQWHKFFMDHPIEWAKQWLGKEEFDHRLSVLQPRVGFRHFHDGFTRFKQHTGKETKDLERVFLVVISGHKTVNDGIMKAMRALLDFIYLAQYESHSTLTLRYLKEALREFHLYKHHIANSGVRSGPKQNNEFHIPKIELMQHVIRLIQLLGSAPQFSSEQTERCHIDMAKQPYKATNRKGFAEQMCRYLDRGERIRLFSAFTEWHSVSSDSAELDGSDPDRQQAAENVAFDHLIGCYLPTPVRNIFQAKKSSLCSRTTAFRLRQKPNLKNLLLHDAQKIYELPSFKNDLIRYFVGRKTCDARLPFDTVSTWSQMRIQLRDPQDPDFVLPALTVQAYPPKKSVSATLQARAGRYNFVLLGRDALGGVHDQNDFGIQGMCTRWHRHLFSC